MKSMSSMIGTIASVLLIGAAVALYGLTNSNLDGDFRTAIGITQRLQQLGTEWGIETARVRSDPGANFDGLADFVPRMNKMKSEFSQSLARIPDLPNRVTANARAYLTTLDALQERVERFKTTYAVVRNSKRYLPVASSMLVQRAHEYDDDEVAREARDLVRELNKVLASADPASKERLRERLRAFRAEGTAKPAMLTVAMSTFASHAAVIIDKHGRAEELFEGVASNTLSERVGPIADALEAEQVDRHRNVALYRLVAIALLSSVVVVWIVLWTARRVWSSRNAEIAIDRKPSADCSPGVGAEPPDIKAPELEVQAKRGDLAETDLIEVLETTGTLAGLIGEGIEICALRMRRDANAIRSKAAEALNRDQIEEVTQHCSRLLNDTSRLRFIARRLSMLARRHTPRDAGLIDMNECLDEVLNEFSIPDFCTVERSLGELPRVCASGTEIRLILSICVESVLHAFQDMDRSEATLEVTTATAGNEMTISFVHSARWPPLKQHSALFMPFGPHDNPRVGIALPSASYLARKYQGKVCVSDVGDKRAAVTVHLPVRPESDSHVSLRPHVPDRVVATGASRAPMRRRSLAQEEIEPLRNPGDFPSEADTPRGTARGLVRHAERR